MSMSPATQKPSYCDHCGNLTYWKQVAHFTKYGNGDEFDTVYILYKCTICKDAILKVFFTQGGDAIGEEQLWPSSLRLSPAAPLRVREIYEEARSVIRRSPSSFVVQIGRALEAITKDRNAKGRSLARRLDWLIEQGELPAVFGEMTHTTRILRNWGAHDAEAEVEQEDVAIVDEFFKAIVEYLYAAPRKVESVQNLIKQRSNTDS